MRWRFSWPTMRARKGRLSGPLWKTHEQYLLDEYEYEYGSLHRPYCSIDRLRACAPRFCTRCSSTAAGMPTLKVGHLTDLHVDVRNDVYEENVKAREHQLKAKAASKQSLSSDELALLTTLGLFNNWNKSVVALYNDAKQDANAILLTGDLIDYGRAHWGQDAGAHLQDDDLYTADRSWFLLSYLLSSGQAYTKPVYTNLGNHDWRINPYPPFAVGAPSREELLLQGTAAQGTVEDEKELSEWESKHADEALRAAHGDGHRREFSYAAKAENDARAPDREPGQSVTAMVKMMTQTKTMNVKDTPAQTTVAVGGVVPAVDQPVPGLRLHAAEPASGADARLGGTGERPVPDHRARQELSVHGVAGRRRGRSRSEGEELPDVAPAGSGERLRQAAWAVEADRRARAADRPVSRLDRQGHARGPDQIRQGEGGGRRSGAIPTSSRKSPDGTTEPWYGHPLFATRPKSGIEGMTADYGSFENQRDWFIENVGDGEIQCPRRPVRAHPSQRRLRRAPARERNGSDAGG